MRIPQTDGERTGNASSPALPVLSLLVSFRSLELTNTSERKKNDYQSWMSDYASILDIDAELTDDVGNEYHMVRFDGTVRIKDAKANTSIYPGKSIKDALVYEPPIYGTDFLRLKLSANAFGEDGELRIQIPKEVISESEEGHFDEARQNLGGCARF